MSKTEFTEKVKLQHFKVKEENATYGLPTTGYSEKHHGVVDTYADGRVEKVDVETIHLTFSKRQNYSK